MTQAARNTGLIDAHLGQVLASVGLDITYHRAEANTLFRRTDDGGEVAVTDYVGGFGSLILGHNDSGVLATAREFLDQHRPNFAQFSHTEEAQELAADLDRAVRRQVGGAEPYDVVFANSGAEAIEIAVKHAEFARIGRLREVITEVDTHVARARDALAEGVAVLSSDAARSLALSSSDPEEFAAAVTTHNAAVTELPPLFVTARGGFHGKLVASVQLTHNAAFREPFRALATQGRFVGLDEPESVAEVVDAERTTLLDVEVRDGQVRLTERTFPRFAGVVLEPIQGEGGIQAVSEEFAASIRTVCAELDCPLITDEVQTGMGRTGAFLAGPAVGLVGDYIVLAKSLGGGLAKVAAVLIRRDRYWPEFELVHSSTFAKDGFGTALARHVLARLEANDGAMYRRVAELGDVVRSVLDGVAAEFPDVVVGVRGRGLMLGMEFVSVPESPSAQLAELSGAGYLGYALSGYLLRVHDLRTFPTGSAPNTLRFAPSVHLTTAQIDALESGLRALCAILRADDGTTLMGVVGG